MTRTLMTECLPGLLSAGDVALDLLTRELTGPAGSIQLPRGPFGILRELLRVPGAVVPMSRLVGAIWADADFEPSLPEQGVRKRVMSARRALERVGLNPDRLKLHHLDGYSIPPALGTWRRMTPEQAAAFDAMMAAVGKREMAA